MRIHRALAVGLLATAGLCPLDTARAAPAAPRCGVAPAQYVDASGGPRTYVAHLPDVKGLDLTLEVTLRGGAPGPGGEVSEMTAKTAIRTTLPTGRDFVDTAFYGRWELDTRRTGTGELWLQDADGRWMPASPHCGATERVEGFTGRITVRHAGSTIDTVGFNAVPADEPLPWCP
ncbi:hypothetical protein ACFV6F_14985 [Kitasatospora phosalacinea]|uniref:hypothetical protein n=1 Tax=Kitasatospora phosalacinea TaxID=2065 RepID=UPI00364B5F14